MNEDWHMDKHMVLMRLYILASQIREHPERITDDSIGRIKLNKIGKALSELIDILRYHDGELKLKKEQIEKMNWYDSVMQYFKR